MKTILIASAVAVLMAAFGAWSNARLEAQSEAYDAYEKCVSAQYGTTPAVFYQSYGYSPECRSI